MPSSGFGLDNTVSCAVAVEVGLEFGCRVHATSEITWKHLAPATKSLPRQTSQLLHQHDLVVMALWVLSFLQPADPPSKLDTKCLTSMTTAFIHANAVWSSLMRHSHRAESLGGLVV